MDKVLVVKAIEPNYNTVSGGPPIMMVGGGRSSGGPAVGRTKRERLGGLAGGTVGVLGALAGKHRSLGGLVQAMISGGAQGKALGGALGRSKLVGVGRQRQARADYDEEAKRDYARMSARGRFENRRYDVNDRINPATMRRRVEEVNQEDELAAQQAKEAQAERMARAKAFGIKRGKEDKGRADRMAQMEEAFQGAFDPEKQNMFNQRAGNVVRVEPAQFEEDPVDHSGAGAPTNAAGLPVPPQLMLPPPTQPPAEGAGAENDKDNNRGTQFNTNATNSALNRNKVAVTDRDEDTEEEEDEMPNPGTNPGVVGVVDTSLQRIQEQEALERQQQGGN